MQFLADHAPQGALQRAIAVVDVRAQRLVDERLVIAPAAHLLAKPRQDVGTNQTDASERFVNELKVGTVNIWEVPGYRLELASFGGIKDSGLGYKEGVQEAMNLETAVDRNTVQIINTGTG